MSFETSCRYEACDALAARLHGEIDAGGRHGNGASILELPDDLDAYLAEHRTVRKRVHRAARRGYHCRIAQRELHAGDIVWINRSMTVRQGRPMPAAYLDSSAVAVAPLPTYPCERHRVRFFGVFNDRRLFAYAVVYRSGEISNVSTILGHGDYLRDEIMFPLVYGIIEAEHSEGGYMLYSRHDSGTGGLTQFKEWFGFEARRVRWEP